MTEEPTPQTILQAAYPHHLGDLELAARHGPIIQFDAREPFFPLAVGITVLREDGPSPSFSRQLQLRTEDYQAACVIEYAIWWDWDIAHLYELEHVWVYLDDQGALVQAEGSFHGVYHTLAVDGQLAHVGSRPLVIAEPGKHAFVPRADWLDPRRAETLDDCQQPGQDGLLVKEMFADQLPPKDEAIDDAIARYLAQHAFTPAFTFTQSRTITREMVAPWPALADWIPQRVNWWVGQLQTGD